MPPPDPYRGDASWASVQAFMSSPSFTLLIETVSNKAAESAAQRVVNETFRGLGLDLEDRETVRSTRAAFEHIYDQAVAKRQRAEFWRKGMIHGAISIAVAFVVSMWGVYHSSN